MKDIKWFYNFIVANEKMSRQHKGYTEYGSRIIKVIDLYNSLEQFEERTAFQKAIEKLLLSGDELLVELGVTICTGFIEFRKKYK
jgi:hypothetical protein